jgi:hypothetical protein
MVTMGLVSLVFASFMLYRRRDIKRMFAYSSIEHMGIITVAFGQALQNASDQGRFAAARDAGDQQVAILGPQKEHFVLRRAADREPVPFRGAHHVRQVGREQLLDQLPDALSPGAAGDQVGFRLDAVQRVRDRDRAAALREERMVVLGIADADHVVR